MKVKLLKILHKRVRWEYDQRIRAWIIYDSKEIEPAVLYPKFLPSLRKTPLGIHYYQYDDMTIGEFMVDRYSKYEYLIQQRRGRIWDRLNKQFVEQYLRL